MQRDAASPWRTPGFPGLWLANAAGDAARIVASFAVSVTLATTLHASSAEVGLVGPLSNLGALLFGVVAGIFVDRWGARRTLFGTSGVRLLAYGAAVAAWLAGVLQPWQLLAVVVLASVADTFFTAAHNAILPSLVGRGRVPAAAAALLSTDQVMTLVGPGAGGLLIRWMPPPLVLAISAVAQLFGALGVSHLPRDVSLAPNQRERFWASMRGGFAFLTGTRLITAMALAAALNNFAAGAYQSAETFFILRQLHMDATMFGLVWSLSAIGGIVGAGLAPCLGRRLGPLRVMFVACCVMPLNFAMIPAAGWFPHRWQPAVVFVSFTLFGLCIGLMAVSSSGVAAALTPDRLLARVASTRRTFTQGATVVGGALGAAAGLAVGVTPVLWVATALAVLQLAPLLWAGIPRRAVPTAAELALAEDGATA